jgi:hypothetical protein
VAERYEDLPRKYIVTERSSQGFGCLALALLGVAAVGYGTWRLMANEFRPEKTRPVAVASPKHLGPDTLETVAVTGAAIDLTVIAPDGRRATTSVRGDSAGQKIPGADPNVDCAGYGAKDATESVCTASVTLNRPVLGDYRVIVTSRDIQGQTLNIGWSLAGNVKSGGFNVRVNVEPNAPIEFTIILSLDGASLRSEPRTLRP